MKIGFHLSISKGFDRLYAEQRRLGCEVIQIFMKNPRSWKTKTWKEEDIILFKRLFRDIPVFAHLSYLPNLAKIDLDDRHMDGLLSEADLCLQIGIDAMVVHCGSRGDKERGMAAVASSINRLHDRHNLSILLENSSGQGDSIGKTMDELVEIYRQTSRKEKVFLCLDTAHLFQAGCDIRQKDVWDSLIDGIERFMGRDKIALLHLNDSKTGLGSRVDRHWHIGEGELKKETFRHIINDQKIAHLCGVMETPKMGDMDEQNMKTMRSLSSPFVPGSLS